MYAGSTDRDPGQQRLGGDLAAEDALPVGLRLAAAVEVDVDELEVEELAELVGGRWHPG